ncbi:MAG: hypothetical protein GX822_10460 [Alcaligenaceae bacterium]|nr:hypothetical protein [Alcaligenaceae bacterium]
MVISGIASSIINAYPNNKLLNYSYREQVSDIIPSLAISLVMGLLVYSLRFLNIETLQLLLVQIVIGVVVYVGLAKVFRIESFS